MEPTFSLTTIDTWFSHKHLSRLHDQYLELALLLIYDLSLRHLDLGIESRHKVVLRSSFATIPTQSPSRGLTTVDAACGTYTRGAMRLSCLSVQVLIVRTKHLIFSHCVAVLS